MAAANAKMVMTYGRHRQRRIKTEAWISPEIKSSAAIFSSPDTDVSIASCNGSMDVSTGKRDPVNNRQSKQSGKVCNLLISPLGRVDELDKENRTSLTPETPEEEQGTRRRGLRKARRIKSRKNQEEGTPKLFSSDSEDGLRKVVGRKALATVSVTKSEGTPKLFSSDSEDGLRKVVGRKALATKNANMWEHVSRGRGRVPSKDRQSSKEKSKDQKKPPKKSAKSRRVKNIIENDVFTVIRSPPARNHRSSKRLRSNSEHNSTTSSDTSMSPFAILESWIDNIATSTPMVELVKVDVDKKVQDEVLLEESLSNVRSGSNGGDCTNHRESEHCRCKNCQQTKDITGKLFQLALSDDDGEPVPDDRTNARKASLRTQKGKSEKEGSTKKPSSIVEISDEDELMEEPSGERRGLRSRRKNVNYKETSDEGDAQEQSRGRGRKKAPQRRTRIGSGASQKGSKVEEDNNKGVECSVVLSNLSCHEVEASLKRPSVVMNGLTQEDASPHMQGGSVVLRALSPQDLESHLSSESTCKEDKSKSPLSGDCAETLPPLSKKMQDLCLNSDSDVCTVDTGGDQEESDGQEKSLSKPRRMTRGRNNQEEDECEEVPVCPATPCNKHLASFHTDSFKEVFTPKKHKDTGLPVTGREKVLQQCKQAEPISITDCITPAMLRKCSKIGEGVYGEVFRTINSKRQSVALKIIPIEGDFEVNDEPQKTFDEILPEIVISRELSYLSGGEVNHTNNYINVNSVSCCQGQYPKSLLAEWDKYDERKGSDNDRPDIFDDNQLFIVFEFADGGQDLESFEFDNLEQAISILQQVASALAVAEQELEFEHRDLHWGNVLIRSTKQDHVVFSLGDDDYSIASRGLEVSIIDFTLSRLQKDDCTVFCDLSVDPTLFEGSGDYQFEIYRKMKKGNKNDWEPFRPHTNVLWLHYITDKLLNHKTYPQSETRDHKSLLSELRSFSRHLLSHDSAEEVVRQGDLFDL